MAPLRDCRQRAEVLETLLSRLPRASLGIWPTPLHALPRLGAAHGTDRLFVKRDDMSGLGLGGNKVRSLEYLLGEAIAGGADTVIASGGLQSNLCRLAAAAAAKLGLRCILVHNAARPDFYQGNMLLDHLAGASQVFCGPMDEDHREVACDGIAAEVACSGGRAYIIRDGASTPVGSLGYVQAALELYRQTISMGLDLSGVVIVGAMGGTAAGLVLGLALLGAPFQARVISVEYPRWELLRRMAKISAGALALLDGCRRPGEPALEPTPLAEAATVHDGYLGEGYAKPTSESDAALLAAAREEGLFLEPVYTAKTLAGCLDLIDRGDMRGGCCFWHTGGAGALFGLADQLQPSALGGDVK